MNAQTRRSQVVTDERWEPLEDQTPREGRWLIIKAHIPPLPTPGNAHTRSNSNMSRVQTAYETVKTRLRTQTSYEGITTLDGARHCVAWRQVSVPGWFNTYSKAQLFLISSMRSAEHWKPLVWSEPAKAQPRRRSIRAITEFEAFLPPTMADSPPRANNANFHHGNYPAVAFRSPDVGLGGARFGDSINVGEPATEVESAAGPFSFRTRGPPKPPAGYPINRFSPAPAKSLLSYPAPASRNDDSSGDKVNDASESNCGHERPEGIPTTEALITSPAQPNINHLNSTTAASIHTPTGTISQPPTPMWTPISPRHLEDMYSWDKAHPSGTATLTATQGHTPTATEECTSSTLSACVFGPLNISRLLAKKGSDVEALLVGAGVQSNDFVLGAAFDRDLLPSGVFIEEAHILLRQELEVDDQTRSDLLDKLGLLLSPHRTLISTPSNQYYSTPYLHGQRCAYEHLIELHISRRLQHDYEDLVLTPLVDQDESGANATGSSGVEFSRDSPGGNGSQREDEDPNGHGSNGPPDDSSHERGGGQGDDGGGGGERKSLNVPQRKVHFNVVFKVRSDTGKSNIQAIRVRGTLSSKDTTDVLLHEDMVSACHFWFLELDFEGNSDHGAPRAHQQFYANIDVDVGERPFHLGNPIPKSTPSQSNTTEQVQVEESSKGVQARAGIKTSLFNVWAGGSKMTKQGSSQKVVVNTNGITQEETAAGVRWGYMVEDPGAAKSGLRLSSKHSNLPSATFTFLGKEMGLTPPEDLKVKIDSCWTIPEAVIRADWPRASMFQRGDRERQPILRDLGIRVTFNMAPHLKKSWTLRRDVTVGVMDVKDTYLFGLNDPSEVEFSTSRFPVAEGARQDPRHYAMEE